MRKLKRKFSQCISSQEMRQISFRIILDIQYLIAEAPYKIRPIQVNGGSEFMLEFENACAE